MGVWLTNSPSPLYYDHQRIGVAMDELQRAGFTRVIPNVWSRGDYISLEPVCAGGTTPR
jgi:uncharacterized lipoprotein YddW (UPF0748 family)